RRAMLEDKAVRSAIAALQGAAHSELRIACTQGLANDFLPSTLAHFERTHPDIRYRIWVDSAKQATQRIETGEADVALTFSILPPPTTGSVKVLYARVSPALAVMSQDHPLARYRRLDIRDLLDYPIALTDENTSTFKPYQLASIGRASCRQTG